jgi:murein DD-endopeptidase MepM/ murein hydrolase activator NlpD
MAEYKIKSGDTLSQIAQTYGTTVSELASLNGISNPNLIYSGQTLKLPGATTQQQSAAPTTPQAPAAPSITPTTPVTKSDDVIAKENKYNELLSQKPGDFASEYTDTVKQAMDKIMNREKFTYDLNGDALYQQYKDQFINQGKLAMQDTIGQAAAMTGGYGNSYAQSVGQQTYQGYLQQLNDKVPELYQLALNQYNQEGEDMYRQYSMLADREDTDYGRHRDTVADWNTDRGFAYSEYRDAVSDSQWQATFDEQVRQYEQDYQIKIRQIEEDERNGKVSREVALREMALAEEKFQADKEQAAANLAAKYITAGFVQDEKGNWVKVEEEEGDEGESKGWFDYSQTEHEKQTEANGGSYYQSTLADLKGMKTKGVSNADANAYLLELCGNSILSRSEYMTLYNKYRDNRL